MKTLYIDCPAGASGDMLLGALVDASVRLEELAKVLEALHLPGFRLEARQVSKNGIAATKLDVIVEDRKTERHIPEILGIIRDSSLPDGIKQRAEDIIHRLGSVEARIHGQTLGHVHLHELGGIDTIVDITGFLVGIDLLSVQRIVASPIPTGTGFTRSAHGKIPLPAPATLALLEGAPVYGSGIASELVTPTGAVLLTSCADHFGPLPAMQLEAVGYGAGSRNLEIPNVLRILLGETQAATGRTIEPLTILETNIDDQNPEIYGYLMPLLLEAGALDVHLIAAQMKKDRPGTLLRVLVKPEQAASIKEILFRETTTLGIRQSTVERECLPRRIETVETRYGSVRMKVASLNGERVKVSPEFEDCRKLAQQHRTPVKDIMDAARHAYRNQQEDAAQEGGAK